MKGSCPEWEIAHSIDDWYDGPRAGAADYEGRAYWYRSVYLDSPQRNHDEDRFELTPLTAEALAWDLELKDIFNRWDSARKERVITWTADDGEATFGSLPNERGRYRDLNARLTAYLAETKPERLVRGRFEHQPLRVQWKTR